MSIKAHPRLMLTSISHPFPTTPFPAVHCQHSTHPCLYPSVNTQQNPFNAITSSPYMRWLSSAAMTDARANSWRSCGLDCTLSIFPLIRPSSCHGVSSLGVFHLSACPSSCPPPYCPSSWSSAFPSACPSPCLPWAASSPALLLLLCLPLTLLLERLHLLLSLLVLLAALLHGLLLSLPSAPPQFTASLGLSPPFRSPSLRWPHLSALR